MLMAICKQEAGNTSVRFVREVLISPTLSVFLASAVQLSDMARFATDPKKFCVLSFDTTFSCGEFYLTIVVYRHLMLQSSSANIGLHPVKIGAPFIHHSRSEEDYSRFLFLLKRDCPALKNLQVR